MDSVSDPNRLLKNPVILMGGGKAGDRVISEARRMWSRLLIPGRRKTFPHTLLGPAMGRNTTILFMVRLCSLADEITRSRAIASAGAEFFSNLLLRPTSAGIPMAARVVLCGRSRTARAGGTPPCHLSE